MVEIKIFYKNEPAGWIVETATHISEALAYEEMLAIVINITQDADLWKGNKRSWLKPKPQNNDKKA